MSQVSQEGAVREKAVVTDIEPLQDIKSFTSVVSSERSLEEVQHTSFPKRKTWHSHLFLST